MSETLTSIDKMDSLNLDRSKWKLVSFGDVALKQNEPVDRETTDLKRYIAGQHMRSEDLHLREWGDVGENYLGPAFTRKFSVGDILYGSRRTYLRKVAVADFEGITANTTFVIKANEDAIVKELLPFVMLSEGFTQHSIRNSKGSVNPYINWKDIANYEFLLPPKDQQAKLAELLWAADSAIQSSTGIFPRLEILRKRILENYFSEEEQYAITTLGELVTIRSGDSPSKFEFVDETVGVPFHKVKDLNESVKYQNFAKEWVLPNDKKLVPVDSVIFPKRGASIMTNKVRITIKLCHVDTNTMALTVNDSNELNPEFLYYYLLYKKLFRIADTSQIPQINNVHINPFSIHLPPIEVQMCLLKDLDAVLELGSRTEGNIGAQSVLLKSLINQIF